MQKFGLVLITLVTICVGSQENSATEMNDKVHTIGNLEYTIGKDQQYKNKSTFIVKIEATEIASNDSMKYSEISISQKKGIWLEILNQVLQSRPRIPGCLIYVHGYIDGNEISIIPFSTLDQLSDAHVYLLEDKSNFRKVNYFKDMCSPLLGEELPEPEFINPFLR